MLELIKHFWPHFAAALLLAMDAWAIGHAVLYKRDSRSAVGWSGIILVFPLLGAILYLLLGINRIQRRAAHLRGRAAPAELPPDHTSDESVLIRHLPDQADHLATLARIVRSITSRPLLSGNHLRLLRNGDQAYPAMLDAIAGAQTSITLSSYIFAHDASGLAFVEALAAAVRRGVEVRVLIDDVGARYSFPPITGLLQRRGVRTATFMPTFFHWRMPYGNLRNHRKLLVVDGRRGFTGGLNIRHNNVTTAGGRDATRDLHTEVEGPVIRHLQEAFAEDWAFTTGERLEGERWFPNIAPAGGVPARGITDGPDEGLRQTAARAHGRPGLRPPPGAHRHPLFPARQRPGQPDQHHRPARSAGGYFDSAPQQPAPGELGLHGATVAGPGARLPGVAHRGPLRSQQNHGGGRCLVHAGLRQLGPAQPPPQF
jgi:cardiolipin synthase